MSSEKSPRAGAPVWWQEMEQAADAAHDRFSVAWWESMRDRYLTRYPDADARSVENMHSFVEQARQRDSAREVSA